MKPKKTCIILANCQGEPLAALLRAHPEFSAGHAVRHAVVHEQGRVTRAEAACCDLLLYQHLGPKWGDQSSEAILSALPGGARAVCIPNFWFLGYWPGLRRGGPIDFCDSLLEELLGRGLTRAEILHLACEADLGRLLDVEGLVAASLAVERDKEQRWDFRCLDFVLARERQERMFLTVNHPGRELTLHVAREVLALLGHPPPDPQTEAGVLPETPMEADHKAQAGDGPAAQPERVPDAPETARFAAPYGGHELPVHPQLAGLRGLSLDDLSKRAGVSKSMLSQIERNQANPTVAVVWRLANALGEGPRSSIKGAAR